MAGNRTRNHEVASPTPLPLPSHHLCACCSLVHSLRYSVIVTATTTVLWPLYGWGCVSQHSQIRTSASGLRRRHGCYSSRQFVQSLSSFVVWCFQTRLWRWKKFGHSMSMQMVSCVCGQKVSIVGLFTVCSSLIFYYFVTWCLCVLRMLWQGVPASRPSTAMSAAQDDHPVVPCAGSGA